MSWILDHLGLLVFFVIGVLSLLRRAKAFLREAAEESQRRTSARPPANYDPEEDDRVRKIQDEIRRKIAERRVGDQSRGGTPTLAEAPPVLRRTGVPPEAPAGEPMRRIFREVERRSEPIPPSLPPQRAWADAAQLERQEHLIEQMRVLEESRMLAARRAKEFATSMRTEAESERGALTVSRTNLLVELRDPRSLRRAFVLREVLSAPVGLR